LTAGTSSAFNVTDQLVVTTQPPASVSAGSSFGMSVTAEDGLGTVDTSFIGSVTVSDPGFSLGGSLTVTAVNGVAAFSGLTQAKAGLQALYANSSATTAVFSNYFTVTATSATKLVALPPSNVLANGPFILTVDAEDPFGNIDPTYNGNVTVALAADPGSAALGGTLTVPAANGVASFSGLTIGKAGFGYTLQESSGGLTTGTTPSFNVTDQLVITTQPPSTITAGSPFNVVVTAEDGQGNVDTSFSGSETVEETLGGITTLQAVNGVAAFSSLTEDYAGKGSIQVVSSGLTTADTNSFTVTAAPATKLYPSAPSSLLANGVFNLTIDAADPFGNIDPTFNQNVTLAIAANPGGATLGGTLTVQAVDGVATFSGLTISRVGSGYTLQASSAGLTGTGGAFNVYDNLVVMTQPPATISAGSPFGLVVAAEDGQGNLDTYFGGTVKIADAYGTALGGTLTVTAVNGIASFFGLSETFVGSRYLDASSSSALTAVNTSNFTVVAAAATKLTLATPSGVLANGPFTLAIDADDPFGNIDTTYYGNVTVALAANPGNATLGGTLTVQAVNGVANFSGLTVSTTGVGYKLQATATALTTGTSATFNVSDKLVVTTQPPSTVSAGSPFGLVVAAEDGQGNLDPSFSASVTVADNNVSGLGGTLTVPAVSGIATFSGLTQNVIGAQSLSVTSNGLASVSTSSFTVKAAAATKLVVSAPPVGLLANGSFILTVDAEDPFGDIDLTFAGNVTLAITTNPGSATLGGTLTVQAVNGVASFAGLAINKTGSGYALQVTSPGLSAATTSAFNVTDKLVVTTPPPATVIAGSPFGMVVAAEDGLGNVDTSFSAKAVNGVASFSSLTVDSAGTQSVTVSSSGLTTIGAGFINVSPAPASALVVTTPSNVLTNAPFGLTVDAEDPFGNRATGFSGAVTLGVAANPGSATLGGTLTVQAAVGAATFTGLTINRIATGYTLQASSSGLTATTALFNVTDTLVVTTPPPSTVTAGSPFGLVVTAEDGLGKVDPSFSGSVAVANSSGFPLGGTLAANAVNGVATFSGLTEDTAAIQYLRASGNGATGVLTSGITVTGATATKFYAQPSDVLANAPFSLSVDAEDPFGNIDRNFSASVTLALAANPGSATLGGTLTAQAVSGVARFSGLTISKTGNGYTLLVSSSGVNPLTTQTIDVTDQLVITTQPPQKIAAGNPFGLVVTAEDALGNIDSSFGSNVTLVDGYGHNLMGTLTATPVNGVATFSGLTENIAANTSLVAASNVTSTVFTNQIAVTAAAPTKLVTSAPNGVLANGPFGLTVDAEDPFGNIDTTFNGSVTLALAANPGTATLGGALTLQAVNGVATFGLTINNPGSGYTLQATSTGLTAATTPAFNVTAVAPAVTSLSPATGPTTGGTSVVITGSNFTGATGVAFGGVAATSFTVNSATQITAVDPAGATAGEVDVRVTAPGGTSTISTSDQFTYVAPPTVVSVTPEDDAGNGVAAGSAAKGQRSMETQIAVVFSEPVNLTSGAFALALVNNYGSGTNNQAAASALTGVLGTPTNPSGDGETWIIPILGTGTVSDPGSALNGSSISYALKGTHGGISGASLDNGVYDLDVTAVDVTATGGGPAMTSNYASAAWHRLYGDVDNARRVFNIEYSAFLAAYTSTYVSNGATNYNEDLDVDGDGRAFNTDYSAFLADFGSTRIYTEPQS
jgi:hypothetical protein